MNDITNEQRDMLNCYWVIKDIKVTEKSVYCESVEGVVETLMMDRLASIGLELAFVMAGDMMFKRVAPV